MGRLGVTYLATRRLEAALFVPTPAEEPAEGFQPADANLVRALWNFSHGPGLVQMAQSGLDGVSNLVNAVLPSNGWASFTSLFTSQGSSMSGTQNILAHPSREDDRIFSKIAVARGLCGQRGPLQPQCTEACAHDELLPYDLPDIEALAEIMPQLRAILSSRHEEDAEEHAPLKGVRRDAEALHTHAALQALKHDFAVVGAEPAAATDDRKGVEHPYEARWIPRGRRGELEAKCAVYEHAAARCLHAAKHAPATSLVKRNLTSAAACLKLQQMESLYALRESVEYAVESVHTDAEASFVTRPCAVVRGVLSFPTDAGLYAAPKELAPDAPNSALTTSASLEHAMTRCAPETRVLRNQIRAQTGEPPRVYVAPRLEEMPFKASPHPTGVVADQSVSEAISAADFNYAAWRRIVARALTNARALQDATMGQVDGVLDALADNQVCTVHLNLPLPLPQPQPNPTPNPNPNP